MKAGSRDSGAFWVVHVQSPAAGRHTHYNRQYERMNKLSDCYELDSPPLSFLQMAPPVPYRARMTRLLF
jgi:hypothetical protein